MDLDIRDRVALVTGSSSGIGRATAATLARSGARIAVTYCKDEARANAFARQLRSEGTDTLTCKLDLNETESIRSAVADILQAWGRIDILVNNAVQWGPRRSTASPDPPVVSFPEWQNLVRANIEGPYTVIRAVLPSMQKQCWGRIVNVSSTFAVDSTSTALDWYATAKASLHGLTRNLYRELGRAGVLINTVMPGLTLTEHVVRNFPKDLLYLAAAQSPLGRLATPEEISQVIAFLASNANTTISGEIIRASGGA